MRLVTVLAILAVTAGCTPDPLEGFEPDASNANNENNANNTSDTGGDDMTANNANNTGQPGPQFIAVADLFRGKCAQIACHGAAAMNTLVVAQNQNATNQEVFDAITSTDVTADGQQLIVANDPDNSNVVVRMRLMPMGDLKEMPQGTGSPAEDIMILETWINSGAAITN